MQLIMTATANVIINCSSNPIEALLAPVSQNFERPNLFT